MSRKIQEDKRYRLFFIELYHDTEDYNYKEIKRILKSFKNYAYITHDKEECKKHDHWVIKLDNAMTGRAFTKKTGIPLKFCQEIINERSCCRYLIHKDDEDKYQYDINKVKTSINYQRFFKKCFEDIETEEQQLQNIFNMCDSLKDLNYNIRTMALVKYVNSNCYDTLYKRYRYEIQNYLKMIS